MKPTFLRRTLLVLAAAAAALATAGPASAASATFAGTASVRGCSGFLVGSPASQPGDPALVLTNGHCFDGTRPVPGEVLTDRRTNTPVNLLDPAGDRAAVVVATKALYVSMTGTDVTLSRLDRTYADLDRDYHLRPLQLSTQRPTPGTAIEVVSGALKQKYSCRLDGLVYRVLESGYSTTDVLRYAPECTTGPGTSGSPVIDAATGQVIGINNTSNRNGGQCTVDNPCEMDRSGAISVHKGIGYGTETYWFTMCLGAGSRLDLSKPGCLLPRPGQTSSTGSVRRNH
ncbi:trypsin-like serine peptidase [Amycolatopsis sp. NPDC051903]|uniref:trypsin-like serine peptidase n=1 Tax=Amycolatopsis sp. NPDC051903 TaxID=3363936 RepID=UPI003787E22E